MSIRFSCGECGTGLKVRDEKAGSRGSCPTCGAAIVVPSADVPQPVEAASLSSASATSAQDPWLSDDPELFDAPARKSLQPRRRTATGAVPDGYQPAPTLTMITTVLIGIIMVFDLGLWIISILQYAELHAPAQPAFDEMPLSGTDLALLGLSVLRLPTFIVCAICFLMWTHRANANAAVLTGRALEISPGWSVGWYFIPFANLVKPYHAMKEIWVASSRNHDSTGLVSLWWGLWIFSGILSQISFRLGLQADTVEKLRVSTLVDIGIGILDLPLSIVAILLVRRIFAMQESWTQGGANDRL